MISWLEFNRSAGAVTDSWARGHTGLYFFHSLHRARGKIVDDMGRS